MAKRRKPSQQEKSPIISPVMIGVVAVGAILLVVGLILLGLQSQETGTSDIDTTGFPALGDPGAPVTLIEFSDYG